MRRILLVDDNPLILTILSDAFANDYLTVTAGSGEEAISLLEVATDEHANPRFDLIITDLHMHKVSGYDLASYVKNQNRQHKFTPVIILTATDATKDEARKYGCAACLSKTDLRKVVSMTHILLPR